MFHLEQKKKDEDDGRWWGVSSAGLPVSLDAGYEVIDPYEETVIGYQANVESEQDEELLVPFSDTVVHPGAVMVHLLDTPDISGENIENFPVEREKKFTSDKLNNDEPCQV